MTEIIRAVKGMNDIYEKDLATWRFIEDTAAQIFSAFGYKEIRTPIVEDIGLFVRGIGESTDVVEKEMFLIPEAHGGFLALRPEGTAGVVRALVERGSLSLEPEFKGYYCGPMFRRERPQKGRLRQFHQIGVEATGVISPEIDVEIVVMLKTFFDKIGLDDIVIELNTLGDQEDRKAFADALVSYFSRFLDELCGDCKRRIEKNPLRLLDCKVDRCKEFARGAPETRSHLNSSSSAHFDAVLNGLSQAGVAYNLNPRLIRGLDYYTRTVFECTAPTGLGSQNAVGGGGRYDVLIEKLGGPKIPAIGFAVGVERLSLVLEERSLLKKPLGPELVLLHADGEGEKFISQFSLSLRLLGLHVERDLMSRSLKSQFRRADRLGARAAMVIGANEISRGQAQIKFLGDGNIVDAKLVANDVVEKIRERKA